MLIDRLGSKPPFFCQCRWMFAAQCLTDLELRFICGGVRFLDRSKETYYNSFLGDTVSVSGVNDDIRQMTVRSALIHGSRCQTMTFSSAYYVHWRIYFQLNVPYPHHDSIKFNSQKLQADGCTRLYISFHKYEHSNVQQTVGRIEIPMICQVTVQQLIDFVMGRNWRDRYRLTDGGARLLPWPMILSRLVGLGTAWILLPESPPKIWEWMYSLPSVPGYILLIMSDYIFLAFSV